MCQAKKIIKQQIERKNSKNVNLANYLNKNIYYHMNIKFQIIQTAQLKVSVTYSRGNTRPNPNQTTTNITTHIYVYKSKNMMFFFYYCCCFVLLKTFVV